MNDGTEVKPRSLRFTWSMKTTSSRDPNEIMAEIKKVKNLPARLSNPLARFYINAVPKFQELGYNHRSLINLVLISK